MIFRFETAIEDRDVESTKVLQNSLVRMMKGTMNWMENHNQPMDESFATQVADFEKHQFTFDQASSKKDVDMKGMPSNFLKALK